MSDQLDGRMQANPAFDVVSASAAIDGVPRSDQAIGRG
jgi:hypothetical protein